jgi:hypothetical protein
VEYVVSAANFLDDSEKFHLQSLSIKFLNLPLFVSIHKICSAHDATKLFQENPLPASFSNIMESIFSQYNLTDVHQQKNIFQLCAGVIQLIRSHLPL